MNAAHVAYLEHLCQGLTRLASDPSVARRIVDHGQSILMLAMLDLEPLRAELSRCYARRKGGRQARDPVTMLRAVIFMTIHEGCAVSAWVKHLRGHPESLIICGFEPDDAPGVGTFYDFFDRMSCGPFDKRHLTSRPVRGHRGRFRRNLKAEKLELEALTQAEQGSRSEGKVERKVKRALERLDQKLPTELLTRINRMLTETAVVPSALRGLLGELTRLEVAADGSTCASHACGNGKRLCDCEQRACACERSYSDAHARWGWDSADERYFFGHRIHAHVSAHGGVELPLQISVDAANVPDVLQGIDADERLYKLLKEALPQARVAFATRDAGYDATFYYRWLSAHQSVPVIALARAQAATVETSQGFGVNGDGVPVCPGGAAMKRHNYNKATGKVVFHCPAKYLGRTNGKFVRKFDPQRCPLDQPCDASKMGPLIYVSVDDDPRASAQLPRDTPRFKEKYARRTAAERFFSFVKEARGLGAGRIRRQHRIVMQLLCSSLERHARAWVRQRLGNWTPTEVGALLETLRTLRDEADTPEAIAAAA